MEGIGLREFACRPLVGHESSARSSSVYEAASVLGNAVVYPSLCES
jgi:hypothetical protein